MSVLLNIVYSIVFLFYLPNLYLKGKLHSGYRMRFGSIPDDIRKRLSERTNIWIHAISVGEVMAVLDLIGKIQERYPDRQIVCSVVTQTGYELAREKLGADSIVVYAPMDFSWIVRHFINVIQPQIYIYAETEIWPNLFARLQKRNVPMIQVNGRISDKSYEGYQRIKFLTRRALSDVQCLCMQSQQDAERIIDLGANSDRTLTVGNLKFDNFPETEDIRPQDLGFSSTDKLLIAGSTHPGEEELLVDVYQRIRQHDGHCRLVICPRHIERAQQVRQVVEKLGLSAQMFSERDKEPLAEGAVLIVDTIGVLRQVYSLAWLVVIGKTFRVGGGQNMLEPAFFGKPVVVGPLTSNFRDIVGLLKSEKAIVQVQSESELVEEAMDIWNNAIRRESLGMAARRVVQKYQGATARTMDEIERLMAP